MCMTDEMGMRDEMGMGMTDKMGMPIDLELECPEEDALNHLGARMSISTASWSLHI